MALVAEINDELSDVLTSKMRIVFYIGLLKQCTLSELREAMQASWSTINKLVPELYQEGLIEITEEKMTTGGMKKIVKLSKKGEAVFNKLLELNYLLNNSDE